jgi:hypothetical protein
MRLRLILYLLISMLAPISSQKQLDSIYYVIRENNQWVNNARRTFQYGQNTEGEIFSSFFANVQKFMPSSFTLSTQSPQCNNYTIQRDNHSYTNGILQKNNSTYYDLNSNCYLEKLRIIRFDGVTTINTEYLNIDVNGNPKQIKYYRFDPNNNNVLVLDFEDFKTYTYDSNKNIKSITTNRKKDGVNNPWSKEEYKYTNNGKVENFLYYVYDSATSAFQKSLEDRNQYKSQLDVHAKYTYNNPDVMADILWIDSTFYDNDKDIIQVRTLSYVLNGNPRSSRADYYYSKNNSSPTNEAFTDIFNLFPNPVSSILNIQNPSYGIFKLKISSLSGKEIMTYQNPTSIDLSSFENGIYILQFIFDGGQKSQCKKILVHH